MRYGEGLLEEIRRRTDLVALVGRRVKLVRKGRVMWGCCPFHAEKSPSFKVENERRLYKCFGCGKGGDAFKWLTETEGLSFPEAVEKLAAEVGVAACADHRALLDGMDAAVVATPTRFHHAVAIGLPADKCHLFGPDGTAFPRLAD